MIKLKYMSEKKLFEKILNEQERFEDDKAAAKLDKITANVEEDLLNAVLVGMDQAEAEALQIAFDEYREVAAEVFKELGGKMKASDVRARISNNLWLDIMNPENLLGPEKMDEIIDFDKMWEEISKKLKEDTAIEELEAAKRNNKIN